MIKRDIITLRRHHFEAVTNHTLPVEHAYKVMKARRAFNATLVKVEDEIGACRKEAGIEGDGTAFDKERAALGAAESRSQQQEKRFAELNAQFERFAGLREKVYEEPVTLEGVKTMPYEFWHALQRENAEKEVNGRRFDILSGEVEDILEGVLWGAPAE